MNFDIFQALGQELQNQSGNMNELEFCERAAEMLRQLDFSYHWDSLTIGSFLSTTSIQQQPDLRFSNLPITVFRGKDFYIEILNWTQATTTIHQHSFSGAFKVLLGSSLHSIYRFEALETINSNLLRGKVHYCHSEYLEVGAVRQITPGDTGLTHRLFHLERPSATLLIRTYGEDSYLPQFRLLPPAFAFNQFKYDADQTVRMLKRLIYTANTICNEDAQKLLIESIASLDFPRLLAIFMEISELFSDSPSTITAFYEAVERRHGSVCADLRAVREDYRNIRQLINARNSCTDPDLRFFLALLMNLPGKDAVLKMIGQRFPWKDSNQLCIDWLIKLSTQKEELSRVFVELAKKTDSSQLRLGARIGAALPAFTSPDQERAFFAHLVAGNRDSPQQHGGEILPWHQEMENIHNIPELGALFRQH